MSYRHYCETSTCVYNVFVLSLASYHVLQVWASNANNANNNNRRTRLAFPTYKWNAVNSFATSFLALNSSEVNATRQKQLQGRCDMWNTTHGPGRNDLLCNSCKTLISFLICMSVSFTSLCQTRRFEISPPHSSSGSESCGKEVRVMMTQVSNFSSGLSVAGFSRNCPPPHHARCSHNRTRFCAAFGRQCLQCISLSPLWRFAAAAA